ncbi:MAG: hypothetical protein LBF04_06405 [Prevotellaceae bacterium]|jgi:hypothetical protein|nr:hypothetical protein [Prevotellaceae bacterium]
MLQIIRKSLVLLACFVFANNVFGQQEICVTIPQIQNVESVSAGDINCDGGDVTLNLLAEEGILSDNFIDEVNRVLKDAEIDYINASGTAPFSSITLSFNANYADNPDVNNPRKVVFISESQNCYTGIKVSQESCNKQ